MANQNNNEMSDASEKAEIRLAKIRDCMVNLIDLICTMEVDHIESDSLDFEEWLSVLGEITVIKKLYCRMQSLESRELRTIGAAFVDSKAGGDA